LVRPARLVSDRIELGAQEALTVVRRQTYAN
jgi:hypothetical protein